jgi:UPF0148 protein
VAWGAQGKAGRSGLTITSLPGLRANKKYISGGHHVIREAVTMEDKNLEKVTRMLERGGTMLAKHCECGAPMFKYQGKVVCPVCDGKKEQAGQESTQLAVPVETKPALSHQAVEPVKKSRIAELPSQRQVSVVIGDSTLDEAAIEAVVIAKINEISNRMANEIYPERIEMYMRILKTSLEVLRELRSVSR